VVVDLVSRTKRVVITRKWPVLDTVVCAGAVAAEASCGVENNGVEEISSIELLLPVPIFIQNWESTQQVHASTKSKTLVRRRITYG
jgi:hypothetical protein